MVSISDIESGRYHWETANSHADNTETANDFIENELPENIEVYFQDGNYMELILEDGRRLPPVSDEISRRNGGVKI